MRDTFHIATMGCQMNVYDSDLLSQALIRFGLSPVKDMAGAGLVIVNTCSVRAKPEQKAYSLIGRICRLKAKRPGLVLGVAGCLAQQEGVRLIERFPEIDFVMGPRELDRFPEILHALLEETDHRIVRDSLDPPPPKAPATLGYFQGRIAGQISVMEGCDNFCSYCIVPYVRGREVSRPPREIIEEAEFLVSEGVRDITLLGQNVNSYHWGGGDIRTFTELLGALDGVGGLLRIRFTTSHPKDLGRDLIAAFGDLDRLCPHIHLPFQAGSDDVLRAMRRGYTRERYMQLIDALRSVRTDIAVTSDVMVGFPGESEADFHMTLDLIRRVRFDNLYSFKYADRTGTSAAAMCNKIRDAEKASRLVRLQTLQQRITLEKNRDMEGCVVEVLVEGESRRGGQLSGRTGTNKVVNFNQSRYTYPELVQVKITRAGLNSLSGEACTASE